MFQIRKGSQVTVKKVARRQDFNREGLLEEQPDYEHRGLVEADIARDERILAMMRRAIPDEP